MKIGLNEQKNGYEMEHFCNCNDFNVMLCLYLILQIAHMFTQLLARSNPLDGIGRPHGRACARGDGFSIDPEPAAHAGGRRLPR